MGSLTWVFAKVLGDINEFIEASVYLRRFLLGKLKKTLTLGHSDWPRYKKNINDSRESPAIKIIEELVNLGAEGL